MLLHIGHHYHSFWVHARPADSRRAMRLAQGINKAVDILEATQAQVSIDRIIGVRAFSLDRVLEMEPAFLEVVLQHIEVAACTLQPSVTDVLVAVTIGCCQLLHRLASPSTVFQSADDAG